MTTDTTYNGHANYETWVVYSWLTDEADSYDTLIALTSQAKADAIAAAKDDSCIINLKSYATTLLQDALKLHVEDNNPLADTATYFTDLLQAAIDNVNWREIAEGLIEDHWDDIIDFEQEESEE